jgi:beta-N-acetylhexosaminidase
MTGFYGEELPADVQSFIHDYHIGFVILFSRNIRSIDQVRSLTDGIHAISEDPPLIFTDQEGGVIVRFGEMAATAVSAMGIAATGSPDYAEDAGRIIAEDMKSLGIDGIFAPVLDVNVEEDNPVIGIRSYCDVPETVAEYAGRFYRGVKSTGLLACGKHYPGHGAAAADSHLEIPEIPVSYPYFKDYCFQPFKLMAHQGIDALMTAHVRFPKIAPDIATFSTDLVRDLLREESGFNGVVFSDCLEMNAVKDNYSADEIVRHAMNAGLDVLVPSHTLDFQKELIQRLEFSVKQGIIPEARIDESLSRIRAFKRSKRKGDETGPDPLRRHIALEQEMADRSVTLLKNNHAALPLEPGQKTLLLEWQKTISGPSIAENETQTMLQTVSADYLQNRRHVTLETPALPPELEKRLINEEDAYVIGLIYSRRGEEDRAQVRAVQRLLELRNDAILVSLESPYEIKKFPEAGTFIVTYGFRKVQVEALFKVLTGRITPSGRLPVEIKNHFPRGSGLESFEIQSTGI